VKFADVPIMVTFTHPPKKKTTQKKKLRQRHEHGSYGYGVWCREVRKR
jgi:hypothetical protein